MTLQMVKKVKTEPETVGYAECENSYALGACSTDANGDALLNFALDGYKSPPATKHTSSPAQEATRARIGSCENQLKKLYKLRAAGKLDNKGVLQIRCLEEDVRKAHAKLRRLLNEAERQRRRRERLRCGLSASSSPSKMLMIVRGSSSGRHGYDGLPTIASYGSEVVTSGYYDDGDGVMTALKQCTRFEDFVKELNSLGLALNRVGEENHVVYDVAEDGEDASDGNVQVQVELIEGEAALEQSMTVEEDSEIRVIKPEPLSPLRSSPELPEVSEPTTSSTQEERFKNTTDNETRSTASTKSSPPTVKTFATEYARKHAQCLRDYHEQFQEWYERQMRSQQHWEENFMREQMELTKSMLENVTSTFLQGMQQVMQSVMGSLNRRSMTPFVPSFPSRNGIELNGLTLNHADLPLFLSSDPTPNGPTVISSQSLIEDR